MRLPLPSPLHQCVPAPPFVTPLSKPPHCSPKRQIHPPSDSQKKLFAEEGPHLGPWLVEMQVESCWQGLSSSEQKLGGCSQNSPARQKRGCPAAPGPEEQPQSPWGRGDPWGTRLKIGSCQAHSFHPMGTGFSSPGGSSCLSQALRASQGVGVQLGVPKLKTAEPRSHGYGH